MTEPSLTTLAARALKGEAALPRGSALVLAVSGGPDSMALLSVLARLAPKLGLALVAHGVDHGLRPEAAGELDLAAREAGRLGVAFERTVLTVPRGANLQERARVARWKALVDAARPRSAAIATAHHADDRAETLLMRMLRGAGLRGLAVLPARAAAPGAEDVTVVRPLLRARRADVQKHLERGRIPSAEDPSNADPRFLRVRVRRELLPLLEALDPGVVRHLEALADEAMRPEGSAEPAELRLPRDTQLALLRLGRTRSRTARVWLPGGLVAVAFDPPHSR